MIDPIFYFVLIIVVMALVHFPGRSPGYRTRYLAAILPGTCILFYAAVEAFYFALVSLLLSTVLFFIARSAKNRSVKNYLPYAGLLVILYPDYYKAWQQGNILFIGSAFFIVRQFVTVKESIKHRIVGREFIVSNVLATFFFASEFTGPIFSGVIANRELKQVRKIDHQVGVFKLLEGFAFVLAFSAAIVMFQTKVDDFSGNQSIPFLDFLLNFIASPLLAFMFVFTTFFGYSKIAEGVAELLGFSVPENFRQPHKSTSFSDFWQRWHRSMADFVMKYLYLPISIQLRNPKLGLMAAFVFMGLWHNVSLGYLFWGVAHGSALIWLQPLVSSPRCPQLLSRAVTLSYVVYVSYLANYWLVL